MAENINVGLGGDVTHLIVSDPAATKEPFTLSYDVAKPNFLDWSKKKTNMHEGTGSSVCDKNLQEAWTVDKG